MILSANIGMVAPMLRAFVLNGSRTFSKLATTTCYNTSGLKSFNLQVPQRPMLSFADSNHLSSPTSILSSKIIANSIHNSSERPGTNETLAHVLEREIQDETAELENQPSVLELPGFNIETDGAEVKLTKKHGSEVVNVTFNVSSSLHEWVSPAEPSENKSTSSKPEGEELEEDVQTDLVSMPEFQVQVVKGNRTLEFSCYFVESEPDEESGEVYNSTAEFDVHEIVLYEGSPKSSEFAVSTEYFNEELQESLLSYLGERGINEEFGRNLIHFATSYEKKQYIDMMKKLKSFVN